MQESIKAAQQQLDDWAAAVRAAAPDSFVPGDVGRYMVTVGSETACGNRTTDISVPGKS